MENAKKTKTSKGFVFLAIIMTLLIGVMTTGSVTLAKYVISETVGSRKANIAKWGFTVEVNASNLFSDIYDHSALVSSDETSIGVKADARNMNLIRPGKSGYMTFTVSGTAQVYSKLNFITSEKCQDIVLVEERGMEDSHSYYPVKWTLKKDGVSLIADATLGAVVSELKEYGQEMIKPGEEPSGAGTYTIEWRWDFNVDDEVNRKDTIIGQIANGEEYENYTATTAIKFGIEIRIEQIPSPERKNAGQRLN